MLKVKEGHKQNNRLLFWILMTRHSPLHLNSLRRRNCCVTNTIP